MTTATPPACPLCGRPLTPRPQDRPQAPPWLCLRDARGWERAELTETARSALRPAYRDFGTGPAGLAVADQVRAEAQDRRRRRVGS